MKLTQNLRNVHPVAHDRSMPSDAQHETADAPAGLPVAAAARRLGLSASTLRSWERRYGLGPSLRTPGGHRRYSAADLVALQQLRQLTESGMATATAARAVRPPAPRRSRGSDRRDPAGRLAAAVEALDAPRARRTAQAVVARWGPATAWTEVFAPLLRRLGDRWEDTGDGVEREHVASDAIGLVLSDYSRRARLTGGRCALLAVAAPGEAHVLPLQALAAALAEHGVPAHVLTALPVPALHAAVETLEPAVLLVWAHAPETADGQVPGGLVGRVPAVYVGGPGWPQQLPDAVAALPDLPAAVAAVRAWAG
jgi:DNA-binding transcriptional MerR regulator